MHWQGLPQLTPCALAAGLALPLAACGGATSEPSALELVEDDVTQDTLRGEPRDLDAFLDAWFADFSDGDTAYLADTGEVVRGGDRRASGVRHRYIRDVAYGPFERNRLDVWLPLGARRPLPLAVYMHGGGFETGDKDQAHRGGRVRRLLEAGYAVASITYRFGYTDPDVAIAQGVPNDVGTEPDVNGARLDYILRDCARAVQYLRYRAADLGLDPSRFGAFGPSAGGGCAMWTATVPDLALPDHPDPALRESSRLQAVGHEYGQVSYNWLRWPELLGFDADWLYATLDGGQDALLQMSHEAQQSTWEGRNLSWVLDYHAHLSPDDPPMFTANDAPDLSQEEITTHSEIVHHVRGHYALYDRCLSQGLTCEIATRDRDSGYPGDMVDFLIEQLAD